MVMKGRMWSRDVVKCMGWVGVGESREVKRKNGRKWVVCEGFFFNDTATTEIYTE